MTALDVRVRRSARSGLIRRLDIPATRHLPKAPDPEQIPPGFDEEAVDEIVALYKQTRRAVEDYAAHPFSVRVTPCAGTCSGMIHTPSKQRLGMVARRALCVACRPSQRKAERAA